MSTDVIAGSDLLETIVPIPTSCLHEVDHVAVNVNGTATLRKGEKM